MKITISLPDSLFYEAEAFAQQKGISQSELCVRALQCLLRSERAEYVTPLLNVIYAEESNALDPALSQAQARALGEDW